MGPVGPPEEQLRHVTVPIRGIGCSSEAHTVEHALLITPGVTRVFVNPATEMAYVEFQADRCNGRAIVESLERAGFGETRTQRPPPRRLFHSWQRPSGMWSRLWTGLGRVLRFAFGTSPHPTPPRRRS